ncbi:MAG: hypothetical protein JKY55_08765 [Aliivibrio sp.]|uniref:hypothetical protein n=1 Tax=Aliivibrio sp. TaxID=1872443 RepID=UPI001A44BB14|nr:hypothetical protein [Aliivibrio sp.]
MLETHLGTAITRRLCSTLAASSIQHSLAPFIEASQCQDHPIYRIVLANSSIWVITRRMVSANYSCRNSVIKQLKNLVSEFSVCFSSNDLILVVADHWYDRSKASKELYDWWVGDIPDNVEEYRKDGINLIKASTHLIDELKQLNLFGINQVSVTHPLSRLNDNQKVKKYSLYYCLLTLQTTENS